MSSPDPRDEQATIEPLEVGVITEIDEGTAEPAEPGEPSRPGGSDDDEDEGRWKCNTCESVCEGDPSIIPTPCDYCGGTDIIAVPLETPLAPPKPPWDDPNNWAINQ
jgi:hypothetical protein